MCAGDCGGKTSVGRTPKNVNRNFMRWGKNTSWLSKSTSWSKASKVVPTGAIPSKFSSSDQYRRYLWTLSRDNPKLYNQIIGK
jgi:hypothetical protein